MQNNYHFEKNDILWYIVDRCNTRKKEKHEDQEYAVTLTLLTKADEFGLVQQFEASNMICISNKEPIN